MTLIALGIFGALWIVERIFTLGDGPQNIGFIASFAGLDSADGGSIRTPQGDIELPRGAYLLAGTFFYLVALAIVAGICKALIGAGARLLSHDVATLLQRMREEVAGLRAHMETKASELRRRQ